MSNNPQYQPQQPQQPQYQQQPMYQPNARKLNQERALWKFIVYTIITCGIYSIVFWTGIGEDINMAASRRDGKKTMHFCLIYFLLTGLTCGIMMFIWYHKLFQRVGDEARARGMQTDLSASTFWLWYMLGSLIIVGPFIATNKLCEAMNYVAASYNTNGY